MKSLSDSIVRIKVASDWTIRRVRWLTIVMLCSWFVASFNAQDPDPQPLRAQVRAYRIEHELAIPRALADLLSIPNVASDHANIRKNADHIVSLLQRRGIQTKLLQPEGSPPVVYGELLAPGATRTIVVYVHYDGQPVVPAQWAGDPWQPVLRDKPLEAGGKEIAWSSVQAPINAEWRLYARSASDDKAPIVALLAGLLARLGYRWP